MPLTDTILIGENKLKPYFYIWNYAKDDAFVWYSCVVTLKPHLYNSRARVQYNKTFDRLKDIVKYYCKRVIIVPEVTKKGNIHYHMLCGIQGDIKKYQLQDAFKHSMVFGEIYINNHSVSSYEECSRVINYMVKELKVTQALVKSDDIIYLGIGTHRKEPAPDNTLLSMISIDNNINEFDDINL